MWPNYLHKVIEHVQEIIEDREGVGSVGMLSGEGNECGNKVFRHFRKMLSRRTCAIDSLRDVLYLHWLYSSPKLQFIGKIHSTQKRCSKCLGLGHNMRTCST
jgi:hypothetical protein